MKFTPSRRKQFLDGLAKWGNVTKAARAIGLDRRAAYDIRERDEAFAKAWDAAIEESRDVLEAEAWRRANEGYTEPVVSHGKIVMTPEGSPLLVTKYSDTLMMALLKGHHPEKYRDRVSTELTGKDGAPLQITAVTVFAQLIERLAQRMEPKLIDGEVISVPKKADETSE